MLKQTPSLASAHVHPRGSKQTGSDCSTRAELHTERGALKEGSDCIRADVSLTRKPSSEEVILELSGEERVKRRSSLKERKGFGEHYRQR